MYVYISYISCIYQSSHVQKLTRLIQHPRHHNRVILHPRLLRIPTSNSGNRVPPLGTLKAFKSEMQAIVVKTCQVSE